MYNLFCLVPDILVMGDHQNGIAHIIQLLKQLQHILTKRGLSVSESQLRRELEQMKARGWITSGTGRGGSRLTDVGLQEYKNRSK